MILCIFMYGEVMLSDQHLIHYFFQMSISFCFRIGSTKAQTLQTIKLMNEQIEELKKNTFFSSNSIIMKQTFSSCASLQLYQGIRTIFLGVWNTPKSQTVVHCSAETEFYSHQPSLPPHPQSPQITCLHCLDTVVTGYNRFVKKSLHQLLPSLFSNILQAPQQRL